MTEFIEALAVLWCCVTYWLGGQEIPGFNRGFKWIRRYLMPAGLYVFLLWLGAHWLTSGAACIGLSASTHLGYSNKVWRYALTGLLMGLPALILCWPRLNWMVLFPMTYHTAYGLISLRSNRFRWAYVGELVGIGIGLAYVTSAVLRS